MFARELYLLGDCFDAAEPDRRRVHASSAGHAFGDSTWSLRLSLQSGVFTGRVSDGLGARFLPVSLPLSWVQRAGLRTTSSRRALATEYLLKAALGAPPQAPTRDHGR